MMALAARKPCAVIGEHALIKDKPGFEVDFLTRGSVPAGHYSTPRHEILMVMRGHWRLSWDGGEATLAPGDTVAVPPGLARSLEPSMTGEASLYRVRNTDDPAGPTWKPN
jgi:quercetin dioxygenase-like cupin family protein